MKIVEDAITYWQFKSKEWQPLDRLVIPLIGGLFILIFFLTIFGKNAAPRVREFSWQDQTIAANDRSFVLQFSHPMDRESVENNLKIEPSLSGKFSWAGRRMAYTLNEPAPYGSDFTVKIEGARDRYSQERQGAIIKPFTGNFISRDRAFAYIGSEGEQAGRLILYNLTQNQLEILTPPNLVVMDFESYPDRQHILFSARENNEDDPEQITAQKLYTATTGLDSIENPGIIEQILDNQTYQNLTFDLSADGAAIVVQRVNQNDPSDFGLWIIPENEDPYPMNNKPGGDFLITPDSQAIAILQGEGVALIPLYPDEDQPADKPLLFLPKFGQILNFAPDGSEAAMVKFNPDYTRSLYLVDNQGNEKELLNLKGSIQQCQFDPTQTTLYCLLSKLIDGDIYQELPYISIINLETNEQTPLVGIPNQRNIQMSLSPDGLALLFDHIQAEGESAEPANDDGQAIASSNLWILPIIDAQSLSEGAKAEPEVLPLKGFRPQWLP